MLRILKIIKMDRFYFFSKSSNKPPGEGAKESGDPSEYAPLAKLPDWRRTLSNYHVAQFQWRGYTWNSIEHAFQGSKIGLQDHDKAFCFTVDSGHFIGAGDGLTAQRHRKCVVLTQENIDIWSRTSQSIMKDAALAKYAQLSHASSVLEATGDAELWHIVPRGRSQRFFHLEDIRTRMRAVYKQTKSDAAKQAREIRASARADASEAREAEAEDDEFYVVYY
jgi:predicted NAD-dependent protein-ADP-ribosyltransferase YbiA (DUF1768 family)